MMKHRFFTGTLLASAIVLGACSEDSGPEVETFSVQVRVEYPSTYATVAASGATVRLRSIERNTTDSATADQSGAVTFQNVVPGSYEVSASRALTEAESSTLTGQAVSVNLNGVVPTQSLLGASTTPIVVALAGSRVGNPVLKEVYYTGSRTPAGGTYFSDQFFEIYNNSTDTIYVDSLYIGDAYGNSGQINPTSEPTPFQADQQHVYLSSVWMIPGNGKDHPLAPGQSIIIAQDGINHRTDPLGNPNSPVDLSTADWETYNERPDNRDTDSPGVPNLERRYFTGGFDWLVPVFGPAIVIFRTPNFEALERTPIPGSSLDPRIRVPVGQVVDAFEALQNPNSGSYKRIPVSLDAGFISASGTYTGESARRKVASTIGGRRVYHDRNNTGLDFEIIATPTPRGP